MRRANTQADLFSCRTLEQRIPKNHPLRKFRVVVDAMLASMDAELDALYAPTGRDSIPPERLLRASLIQTLFSIRSERQRVTQIDDNLVYRGLVGLGMDEAVWNHSTFNANRDRLLNETIARSFFAKVLGLAEWQGLVSDEHFSVDGTLIEAWASMKSFVKKDGPPPPPPEDGGRNPTVIFKGEPRSNDTHASTTDPDARLYKKSDGDKSRLCYLGHALMENRHGLPVDVETTLASGTAERDAAKTMVARTLTKPATLGADKGYDVAEFVDGKGRIPLPSPTRRVTNIACRFYWHVADGTRAIFDSLPSLRSFARNPELPSTRHRSDSAVTVRARLSDE
jgi:transposase